MGAGIPLVRCTVFLECPLNTDSLSISLKNDYLWKTLTILTQLIGEMYADE